VGFEPTERFPVHSISSAASSTTPAPLLISHKKAQKDQPQKGTKVTKRILMCSFQYVVVKALLFELFVPFCG
jgi:hypothetical protein